MQNRSNKKVIIILLMLCCLVLIPVISCNKEKPEKQGVIKIGAILPLTGDLAFLGNSVKAGLIRAKNDLNLGKGEIELFFEDSKGEIRYGVSGAQRLMDIEKVSAIIAYQDGVCNAIIPMTRNKKVIQISMSMNPLISIQSEYSFTIFCTSKSEVPLQLEYIKHVKPNKIAVIYVNMPGHSYAVEDLLIPGMEAIGIPYENIYKESIELTDRDFSSPITKIAKFKPDLIVAYILPTMLDRFYRKLSESSLSLNIPILGNMMGIGLPTVSPVYSKNTVFPAPAFFVKQDDNLIEFLQRVKDELGAFPSLPEAIYGYDSLNIIFNSIMNCNGNVERAKQYIANLKNYKGLSGYINIDNDRNSLVDMILAVYKEEKFQAFEFGKND